MKKQTQKQIGDAIGKSRKWVNIFLKLRKQDSCRRVNINLQNIILVIDTTYFEQFGIMVFRAENIGKNLLWYKVEHETNELYRKGIQELIDMGFIIDAIVADGKPGLGKLFLDIPFQLCHFHQFQIITRYISKKPKLQAGKELRNLLFRLKETDRASFEYWLFEWHKKWQNFLNEKTECIDLQSKRRWWYTHKNLRSAYSSLKRNLSFLFTFEALLPEKLIPNTTNSLDGYFSHLKTKLAVHRGASKITQLKLMSTIIFS